MTEPYYFDTDCIAAFLWVKEESLIPKLYPGRVIIPQAVYDEFSRGNTPHLKARLDVMIKNGQAKLADIDLGTEEYDLFEKMTLQPEEGMHIIGDGEAAAIAMAKCRNGILASNNLSDITFYIKEFNLQHTTTGMIMVDAYNRGMITLTEAETIWALMLEKRRRLGADTFAEYLASHSV